MMQTDTQHIQCFQKKKQKKKKKTIANQCSKSEVIDFVGELLTRHWNAWHSERHCVFTAGSERVNLRLYIIHGWQCINPFIK
jgi:hypothetical protein